MTHLAPVDVERMRCLQARWHPFVRDLAAWRCDDLSVAVDERESVVSTMRLVLRASVRSADGTHVGAFDGYMDPTADLIDSVVVLNRLELDPSARGRDFGRRLLARLERGVEHMGFARMRVHAFSVGAYVWAQAGFAFDVPHGAETAEAGRVVQRAEYHGALVPLATDPRTAPALHDLLRRIDGRPERTATNDHALAAPSDFVAFVDGAAGHDAIVRRDVIRAVMSASHWRGVKDLGGSANRP